MVPAANTRAVSLDPASSVPESLAATRLLKWCPQFREPSKPDSTYLFCFPFAGGGASAFGKWAGSFPDQIVVTPIQYPGRETRWSESGFATLTELAERIADDFKDCWPRRFAFFGHSFGALLAYELARIVKQRDQPLPVRLFLAGARAPHLPLREQIHDLADERFLSKLQKFNGLPDELLKHPNLIAAVLPIIKEDFRLFEQHRFKQSDPLDIPMSVFGGFADDNVAVPELLSWSRHTSKAFRSRFLKGSHFFIFDSVSSIAGYIQQDLAACSPATGAEVG